MISGRTSFIKGTALFGLALTGAVALIGVFYSRVIGIISSLLVAAACWGAAYRLYQRWKDR